MSREEILQLARSRRRQARVLTKRGDYQTARRLLADLVTTLAALLLSDQGDLPADATADGTDASRTEVARALVDAYGMLGGVEWRDGNLPAALAAYQSGRQIEEDESLGVEDSYNLTNSIVLMLMLSPGDLEQIRPQVARAAQTVKAQIEGPRRDQWWAWADYGLLCLLLGDVSAAETAYRTFFECGPGRSDFESVRRVLTSVAPLMTQVDEDAARHMTREVAFMDEQIETD